MMWFGLIEYSLIVGLVLVFNGVVQLSVRKKRGPWKEGGAAALTGAIVVGGPILSSRPWTVYHAQEGIFSLILLGFSLAGLVLVFNGVVQLSVREKTGPWKEGGAAALVGVIILGVPIFLSRPWMGYDAQVGIVALALLGFSLPSLVLVFNGVVQLSVRNKTGAWKEGGASLLAGVIVAGVAVFWMVFDMPGDMPGFEPLQSGHILFYCVVAGVILLFNGVVQVCVRNRTGAWKEGGASLLAGVIIGGSPLLLPLVALLFRRL